MPTITTGSTCSVEDTGTWDPTDLTNCSLYCYVTQGPAIEPEPTETPQPTSTPDAQWDLAPKTAKVSLAGRKLVPTPGLSGSTWTCLTEDLPAGYIYFVTEKIECDENCSEYTKTVRVACPPVK